MRKAGQTSTHTSSHLTETIFMFIKLGRGDRSCDGCFCCIISIVKCFLSVRVTCPLISLNSSCSVLDIVRGQQSNSRLSVAYHEIFSALGSGSHSSYAFISTAPRMRDAHVDLCSVTLIMPSIWSLTSRRGGRLWRCQQGHEASDDVKKYGRVKDALTYFNECDKSFIHCEHFLVFYQVWCSD